MPKTWLRLGLFMWWENAWRIPPLVFTSSFIMDGKGTENTTFGLTSMYIYSNIFLLDLTFWISVQALRIFRFMLVTIDDLSLWTLNLCLWTLNFDIWTLTFEPWPLTFELWPLNFDPWPLTSELWPLNFDPWPLNFQHRWCLEKSQGQNLIIQ